MLLHVKIIEATNIPKMGLFSKIRPRVSLFLFFVIKVKKTKANNDSNHPIWNKKFHFNVTRPTQTLHLKLFGEARIGDDITDIAQCEVPLNTLPIDIVVDRWIPMSLMMSSKSKPNLHVQLHYAHPYIQPFVDSAGELPLPSQQDYQPAYYPPPLPSIYNQPQYHPPAYQNVQQPTRVTRPCVPAYYPRVYQITQQPSNFCNPAASQQSNASNKSYYPNKPMYPPPPLSNFHQQKLNPSPNRGYCAVPTVSPHLPMIH